MNTLIETYSSPCSLLPNEMLEKIFSKVEPAQLGSVLQVCRIWFSCCQKQLNSYRNAHLYLRQYLYLETARLLGNDNDEKDAVEISQKSFLLSELKIQPIQNLAHHSLCRTIFDYVSGLLEDLTPVDDTQICSFLDRKIKKLAPPSYLLMFNFPIPLDSFAISTIPFLPQNFVFFPSPLLENQLNSIYPKEIKKIFFYKKILKLPQSKEAFLGTLSQFKNLTSIYILNQPKHIEPFGKCNNKIKTSVFKILFPILAQLPNLQKLSADDINFSDEDADGLAKYIEKGHERSKVVYCVLSGTNRASSAGYKLLAQALLSTERGFALSINDLKITPHNRKGIKKLSQVPSQKRNVVINLSI